MKLVLQIALIGDTSVHVSSETLQIFLSILQSSLAFLKYTKAPGSWDALQFWKKSYTFSTSKVTVAAGCSMFLVNICKSTSICMLPRMIKEQRCLNILGEKFGSKAQLLQILKYGLNSLCVISITVSLIDVLAYVEVKEWVNLAERFMCEPQCKLDKLGNIEKDVTLKIVRWWSWVWTVFSFWVESGISPWIGETVKGEGETRLQKQSKDQKVPKINSNWSLLCSFLILPVLWPDELPLEGVVERIVWDCKSYVLPPPTPPPPKWNGWNTFYS